MIQGGTMKKRDMVIIVLAFAALIIFSFWHGDNDIARQGIQNEIDKHGVVSIFNN